MNGDPDKTPASADEAIFNAAVELPPAERPAYLDQACANNPPLRQRVEALLQASADADGFLPDQPDDPVAEDIGARIGRYKLIQKLGEGGWGVVYLAEQEEPVRRRVALKIIKLGMDTKTVIARFEAERQALAMMDHPNIAKIFDAGVTGGSDESEISHLTSQIQGGRPYFVMELVEGVPITAFCAEQRLSPRQRLKLFIQVCQAIQHAHQKGIIHRDIKPSNILVTLVDGKPVPKVIDFGIAKAVDARWAGGRSFTGAGQLLGTLAYMSPEQVELVGPLDIDTRSDIYALGVLLYELLTGTTPFDARELEAAGLDGLRRLIRDTEPERPSTRLTKELVAADVRRLTAKPETQGTDSEINADEEKRASSRRRLQCREALPLLRGDLDWIVMQALEKDRTRRYATANDFAADLQRHLNSEPVLARPPSTFYRFQKMVRRHRSSFAAAAAVLLALLVGLAVSLGQAHRARRAERAAATEAAKSKQAVRVLTKMLSSVNPEHARGRDTLLLREILDDAAKWLDTELAEVEAPVRNALGKTYRSLGLLPDAQKHAERALILRERALGSEHPDTLESQFLMALLHSAQSRHPEAEALMRRTLEAQKRLLGPENPATLQSMNGMGAIYFAQRRFADAEAMWRQTLAMEQRVLARADPEIWRTMNNLGTACYSLKKLAEAEVLFREALNAQREVLGSDHPDTLSAMNNVAGVLFAREKPAEAETLIRQVLDIELKVRGPVHQATLRAKGNLANACFEQGKWSEAETLARESLDLQRKVLAPGHPDTLRSLRILANACDKLGKQAEVEALLRELQDIQQRSTAPKPPATPPASGAKETTPPAAQLPPPQPRPSRNAISAGDTRIITTNAASGNPERLYRDGNFAEAEILYRQGVQSRLAATSPTDELVLRLNAGLARCLADWAWESARGRSPSAAPTNAAAHSAPPAATPPSDPLRAGTARAPSEMAREAETLLRAVLTVRERSAQPDRARIADVKNRLGFALVAVAAVDSSLTTEARVAKLTEAETLLQETHRVLRRASPAYQRDALTRFARLYEAWDAAAPAAGKAAEAAKWREALAEFDRAANHTPTPGGPDKIPPSPPPQ